MGSSSHCGDDLVVNAVGLTERGLSCGDNCSSLILSDAECCQLECGLNFSGNWNPIVKWNQINNSDSLTSIEQMTYTLYNNHTITNTTRKLFKSRIIVCPVLHFACLLPTSNTEDELCRARYQCSIEFDIFQPISGNESDVVFTWISPTVNFHRKQTKKGRPTWYFHSFTQFAAKYQHTHLFACVFFCRTTYFATVCRE